MLATGKREKCRDIKHENEVKSYIENIFFKQTLNT